MATRTKEFGRFRSFFWPIHRFELRKLLPMLLIFFLITFNYNILRNAKDALVVTQSGAETIPFIKVWAMLPMAFFMTFIFTRLANRYKKETIFYWMVSIFLAFFLLFITVLYPFRDVLHPHQTADWLATVLPSGLKGFIAMFRNWTFTAFYVMSELWGSIMLQLLFWGYANDVTSVKEAKRFYGLFGIGANCSGIAAGQASIFLSALAARKLLPIDVAPWTQSLILLTSSVIVIGLLVIGLFWHLNNRIIPAINKDRGIEPTVAETKAPKIKMSMKENFAYLAKSKYLLYIAIIVLVYNTSINLTEVLWKSKVHELCPDPNIYNAYMGQITFVTSIIATLTAMFLSGNIIRKFGWTFSALITPTILLITTVGFFSFLVFQDTLGAMVAPLLSTTPLAIAVFFGSAQNCLSRASKYTLFDPTKEMAFIPLNAESKIKGKAAIDGVGTRLGKSCGSTIYQALFLIYPTLAAMTPVIGGTLLVIGGVWMFSVRNLGNRFNELTASQEEAVEVQSPKTADSIAKVAANAATASQEAQTADSSEEQDSSANEPANV